MAEKTLEQKIAELTTKQIVQLIDCTWDEPAGQEFRLWGFDIIEDRHGRECGDRLYCKLWHKHEKPFDRATVQYRPDNPAGHRYDVKLWTLDIRSGAYAYAGNGKTFRDLLDADQYAHSMAYRVEHVEPSAEL